MEEFNEFFVDIYKITTLYIMLTNGGNFMKIVIQLDLK